MEITWRVLCFYIGLSIVELCNGLPMDLLSTKDGPNAQLIGVLVAVMVSVCIVVAVIGCVCCRRRQGFKEFRDSPVTASVVNDTTLTGDDPGHVNPIASPEFTIFTPLTPPHHNNNVFRTHQPVISYVQNESLPEPQNKLNNTQIDGLDVSGWFDGSESDFPRTKLKYIRELGSGWFGRVVEGEAQGINNQQDGWTPVAVRILESSASAHEQALFLHEAKIYRIEQSHPNVLRLLGRSLEATPLLLIQEFSTKGDLKRFLLENRSCSTSPVMLGLPLQFCCQLSSALQYLHDNKIPHLDLAARNCQISPDMTLKLGDYGLAVTRYPKDYYQGTPAVPVRWRAPESLNFTNTTLQPKLVTCEDNIWSFGVTMWEICEWGAQPYEALTDDEVISQVMASPHIRLQKPTLSVYYINSLYRLMQLCWQSIENRPLINQIHSMLVHLMQTYHQNMASKSPSKPPHTEEFSAEAFDSRWQTFKPNTIVKTDNHIASVDNKDITSLSSSSEPFEKSPSLTNLHGSFENLDESTAVVMDSWLQNVASDTGDMQYVRGLSQAIQLLDSALASEQTSSSGSSSETYPKIEFKLGLSDSTQPLNQSEESEAVAMMDSIFLRRSESGSETEDETWKKRIERGAYSEVVRQKSKSVADLMILTHIDCSDTDSETPLQSLEYRAKTARLQNFDKFGSEGNLLAVQDTFQEELKKLQEERRDSLLFVPGHHSSESDLTNIISSSSPSDNKDLKRCDSFETVHRIRETNESPPKTKDIDEKTEENVIKTKDETENIAKKPHNIEDPSKNSLSLKENDKNHIFPSKNDRETLSDTQIEPKIDGILKNKLPSLEESNKNIIDPKNEPIESNKVFGGQITIENEPKLEESQVIDSKNESNTQILPKTIEETFKNVSKIEESQVIDSKDESNIQIPPKTTEETFKNLWKIEENNKNTSNPQILSKNTEDTFENIPKMEESNEITINNMRNEPKTINTLSNPQLESKTEEPSSRIEETFESEPKIEESMQNLSINSKNESESSKILSDSQIDTKSIENPPKIEENNENTIVLPELELKPTIKHVETQIEPEINELFIKNESKVEESNQNETKFDKISNISAPEPKIEELANIVESKTLENRLKHEETSTIFENITENHQPIVEPTRMKTQIPETPENRLENLISNKIGNESASDRLISSKFTPQLSTPQSANDTNLVLNHFENIQAQTFEENNKTYESLEELLNKDKPIESWLENVTSDANEQQLVHGLTQTVEDLDRILAGEEILNFEPQEVGKTSNFEDEFAPTTSFASSSRTITINMPIEDVIGSNIVLDSDKINRTTLENTEIHSNLTSDQLESNAALNITSNATKMAENYLKPLDFNSSETKDKTPIQFSLETPKENLLFASKPVLNDFQPETNISATERLQSEFIQNLNQSVQPEQQENQLNLIEDSENNLISSENLMDIFTEMPDLITDCRIQNNNNNNSSVELQEQLIDPEKLETNNINTETKENDDTNHNSGGFSVIQNFINNERMIPPTSIDQPKSITDTQTQPTNIDVTSNLLETLTEVPKINQVYNVFNVTVDHKPSLEYLYNRNFDKNEIFNALLEKLSENDKNTPTSENKSSHSLLDPIENRQNHTNTSIPTQKLSETSVKSTELDGTILINNIAEIPKVSQQKQQENSQNSLETIALPLVQNYQPSTLQKLSEKSVKSTELNETIRTNNVAEIPKVSLQKQPENSQNSLETLALPLVQNHQPSTLQKLSETVVLSIKTTSPTLSNNLPKDSTQKLPEHIENITEPILIPQIDEPLTIEKQSEIDQILIPQNNQSVTIDKLTETVENSFGSPETSIVNEIDEVMSQKLVENLSEISQNVITQNNDTLTIQELAETVETSLEQSKTINRNECVVVLSEKLSENTENLSKTNNTPIINNELFINNEKSQNIESNTTISDVFVSEKLSENTICLPEQLLENNEANIINSDTFISDKSINIPGVEKLSEIRSEDNNKMKVINNNTFVTEEPEDIISGDEKLSENVLNHLSDNDNTILVNDTLRNELLDLTEEKNSVFTSTPFIKQKFLEPQDDQIEKNVKILSFVSEGDEINTDLQSTVILGPCEDYSLGLYSSLKTTFGKFSDDDRPEEEILQFSSNFMPLTEEDLDKFKNNLEQVDYSLDTWDNFLGKSLKEQELGFENFSPKLDSLDVTEKMNRADSKDQTFEIDAKGNGIRTDVLNGTYKKEIDKTFVLDSNENKKEQLKDSEEPICNSWEPGEGWFLHPQTSPEDLTGQIDISGSSEDVDNSYIGFTLDVECVNALRNELAAKLPHAQGLSHEQQEPDEWDPEERNEVIVKYNVYATPLSPIPEESCCDDVYIDHTQHNRDNSDTDSDWSDPGGRTSQLEDILVVDTETHTALILESPSSREPQHRHTPSQDSCCSNDTLFNLDDLNYGPIENSPQNQPNHDIFHNEHDDMILQVEMTENETLKLSLEKESEETTPQRTDISLSSVEFNKTYTKNEVEVKETGNSSEIVQETIDKTIGDINKTPEKLSLEENYQDIVNRPENINLTESIIEITDLNTSNSKINTNLDSNLTLDSTSSKPIESNQSVSISVDLLHPPVVIIPENSTELPAKLELNLDPTKYPNAAPLPSPEDIPWRQLPASLLTFSDVSQDPFETHESDPDQSDPAQEQRPDDEFSDSVPEEEDGVDPDVYSNLTDIRFSGPSDTQLMSTSFSESVEYADERDWDSGSDTRSSSSGEFIWKEGEHEESLRALHAASNDVGVLDDVNPMDAIEEEENSNTSNDEDDDSDDNDEDDIEETEFVPSAWDAQATPTKSALRSPENSNKRKNPQKGVWFKKQKYHCVYEYPREPESPVAQSTDLWRPLSDFSNFTDWELDPESCVAPFDDPALSDGRDLAYDSVFNKYISRNNYPLTSPSTRHRDLYQLNPFTDLSTGMPNADEDFFISSSARPFQGQGSQFFPGQQDPAAAKTTKSLWTDYQSTSSSRDPADNITPDSGLEDLTPADSVNLNLAQPPRKVQTLKYLAELATRKSQPTTTTNAIEPVKTTTDALGGLRHTRNRLKLDLPPSPNSFTAQRSFTIDVTSDPVLTRELPTFTTFGKSRFSVQHVHTPTEESSDDTITQGFKYKNVSFEALPHKPIKLNAPNNNTVFILEDKVKQSNKPPVEMVQGEASLLDSADEDSGIESSANATLERHQQQILNRIQ